MARIIPPPALQISDPDLVSVGDGSTINEHVDMSGHEVRNPYPKPTSGVTASRRELDDPTVDGPCKKHRYPRGTRRTRVQTVVPVAGYD